MVSFGDGNTDEAYSSFVEFPRNIGALDARYDHIHISSLAIPLDKLAVLEQAFPLAYDDNADMDALASFAACDEAYIGASAAAYIGASYGAP